MKCRKDYKDQEKYRIYRNNCNKRYYKKRAFIGNRCKLWTDEEIKLIFESSLTDTELALELGRSVMAIQVQRSKIKKRRETENEKGCAIRDSIPGTGAGCGA